MKKINKILSLILLLTSISIIPANASEYENICAPQGWLSCAEFTIYDSAGVEKNRVIGPISINSLCGPSMCGGGVGGYAVIKRSITPTPIINKEVIGATTLTATINVEAKTMVPRTDGVVGPRNPIELAPIITPNTSAIISASETQTVTVTNDLNIETTEFILVTETESFTTPQTRDQLNSAIENKLLIIHRYLNRFYVLLNGWLID
jgi:hypothetical protein